MSRFLVTPITQRDIAHACGVSVSTICLALQQAPSIPHATRERVHAMAAQLGYQPNAAARNLASLRTERRSATRLPLAWINQEPQRDFWRTDAAGAAVFAGVKERAEKLGYYLDEFWAADPQLSVGRLTQILQARGIEGVILPINRHFSSELVDRLQANFASVALNDHRLVAWVDTVCPDFYHNTGLLLRHLQEQGYERPGLVLDEDFDAATNGLVRSRFLRAEDLAGGNRPPIFTVLGNALADCAGIANWQAEHRPDVVIYRDAALAANWPRTEAMTRTVQLQFRPGAEGFAGIDERVEEVASTAVDRLCGKIQRFEKGLSRASHLHLVKGMRPSLLPSVHEVQTAA